MPIKTKNIVSRGLLSSLEGQTEIFLDILIRFDVFYYFHATKSVLFVLIASNCSLRPACTETMTVFTEKGTFPQGNSKFTSVLACRS